jgi:N-methylhydantoinase B/oxoprolinase/acetone carboxylase alpha subunit
VIAGAYYVVRTITDPAIPNNSGCYRSVHLHLPEGTVVNPHPPAAVNARTATIIRIADVLPGALVQAMPGKLPAASSGQLLVASFGGVNPRSGAVYVTSELGAGGVGARPYKDGIDLMEMGPSNCMHIPVEAIECATHCASGSTACAMAPGRLDAIVGGSAARKSLR